jgi:hypothetical protein
MFERLRVAVEDLKRHAPKKNGKLWIAPGGLPNPYGGANNGVKIFDEDGPLTKDPLREPNIAYPPWDQVVPLRIKRREYKSAREISLDMVRCGKLLGLVQAAVGCRGIMQRIYHPLALNKDNRLDVIRFDTEPGTHGMRAFGALCGRKI